MKKRQNKLQADKMLHSIHYMSVHRNLSPEERAKDIEEMLERCGAHSFVYQQDGQRNCQETMYAIARMAKRRNWPFAVLYFYQESPMDIRSFFDAEMVAKLKGIAGDLFLGEYFGETGTLQAAKDAGYYVKDPSLAVIEPLIMPPQDFQNMQEAKEHYIGFIKNMLDYNHSIGVVRNSVVEPTAFHRYNLEAGMDYPCLEVLPADPEYMVPFTRGAAIGYGCKEWHGYVAQECYGGFYHEDKMKPKRLDITYRWLYMNGCNVSSLESGVTGIQIWGYNYSHDHELCQNYVRSELSFEKLIQEDKRFPCGPYTKVAFLHGNCDGFTGFLGGSSWAQFGREEWGKSSAEHSWNILNEVYRKKSWCDTENVGDQGYDLSQSPAYGVYDVLPVESPVDTYKNYDLLIFCGWNTMTAEIYEKLKEYVKEGGHLFVGASHLSTSVKRGERKYLYDGQLAEFLGANIKGEVRLNHGVKFTRDSKMKNVFYPAPKDLVCDAFHPEGFANWVDVEVTTARLIGVFSDTFDTPLKNEKYYPMLLENDYGKGIVSFMTNADYPGHSAVYPVYRTIVKELLTATHKNCDLKVISGDKVRYSLFYDDKTGDEKLYILNTDFNLSQHVIVKYQGQEKTVVVQPTELISIEYPNQEQQK